MATKSSDKNEKVMNKVTELIKFASENNISELELETKDFGLKVKKHAAVACTLPEAIIAPTSRVATASNASATKKKAEPVVNKEKIISTPLTGTFYRAKSPTSAPLAKEGDFVTPGTVIGLVSACKNLNEIISDKSGKIAKFAIKNEENVSKGDAIVILE